MELSAKERLTKGAWDPEEDQKLIAYIRKHGIKNWSLTPKAAELSRSGKSCRLRWMNYLRPDLKRGRLTVEEIKTIVELHESLGNKWPQIAAQLPGRTDNEIKNFWHTHIRKCFRTVRGANRCKSKRTKREEKTTVAKVVRTSISYGAAQESNSENSSTIPESIDEFPIAESYSPIEDSCAIIDEINEMQNISSSESHREIHENFCMETFPIFEDLHVPEIDSTIFEELGFANQDQEYKPDQESTHAPINDELTSFWFNILMEANYI